MHKFELPFNRMIGIGCPILQLAIWMRLIAWLETELKHDNVLIFDLCPIPIFKLRRFRSLKGFLNKSTQIIDIYFNSDLADSYILTGYSYFSLCCLPSHSFSFKKEKESRFSEFLN